MRVCCNFFPDWAGGRLGVEWEIMCCLFHSVFYCTCFCSFWCWSPSEFCWKFISCCCLLLTLLYSPLLSCSMAFYLEEVMSCTRSLLLVVSGWVPRHVVGAVLVSLPAISVLSHLTCSVHLPLQVNLSLDGCLDKNLEKTVWEKESKERDCAVCGHSSRSTTLLWIEGLYIYTVCSLVGALCNETVTRITDQFVKKMNNYLTILLLLPRLPLIT